MSSGVKPPFGPPDCPWRAMTTGSSVPEKAVYHNGKLNGDEIYIGRVHDGQCIFVGTAIPKKGICIYLNKSLEVKSSPNYEILTVECGNPLWFLDMELDNKNVFVAGIDENKERLYVGRHTDNDFNTYYGWISKSSRSLHIPRESNVGPQVLDKDYGVLIHRYLDRLCICPCGPCTP